MVAVEGPGPEEEAAEAEVGGFEEGTREVLEVLGFAEEEEGGEVVPEDGLLPPPAPADVAPVEAAVAVLPDPVGVPVGVPAAFSSFLSFFPLPPPPGPIAPPNPKALTSQYFNVLSKLPLTNPFPSGVNATL